MLPFNLESKSAHKLLIILVTGHYKGPVYMKFAEVFVLVPINQTKGRNYSAIKPNGLSGLRCFECKTVINPENDKETVINCCLCPQIK